MDNNSRETLSRVTQNDPSMTTLSLADTSLYYGDEGDFYSVFGDDYSALGAAVANNTHLTRLIIQIRSSDYLPLGVADREFYDGLKSNSSINELLFHCYSQSTIAEGVAQEIFKAYQKNGNLTVLRITNANLQNGGDRVIVDTLRNCRNLSEISLRNCDISAEQLLPMVDAIREHNMLEVLDLHRNNIGNVGCEAIATLLADPNCNIRDLGLDTNTIDNEGATAIANSLKTNNKLQRLYLGGNQIDQIIIEDVFSNILCNTSNINSLYASNHTLGILSFGEQQPGQNLVSLLRLNEDTNKNHVASRKILHHYPDIDMEPLFQWDAEGEQTLKALPYVIDWFDRAEEAVADGEGDSRSSSDESNNEEDEEYNIEERKLSAIFQFAKFMPLLFVHTSNIKIDNKKRKRLEGS